MNTIARMKLPAQRGWWPTQAELSAAMARHRNRRAFTLHTWSWDLDKHLDTSAGGYALRRAALLTLPRFRPHCP